MSKETLENRLLTTQNTLTTQNHMLGGALQNMRGARDNVDKTHGLLQDQTGRLEEGNQIVR